MQNVYIMLNISFSEMYLYRVMGDRSVKSTLLPIFIHIKYIINNNNIAHTILYLFCQKNKNLYT